MTKKHVEQNLVAAVHHCSGLAPKFVSPVRPGVLNRLALMPHGCMDFIELKAPRQVVLDEPPKENKRRSALGVKKVIMGLSQRVVAILMKRSESIPLTRNGIEPVSRVTGQPRNRLRTSECKYINRSDRVH